MRHQFWLLLALLPHIKGVSPNPTLPKGQQAGSRQKVRRGQKLTQTDQSEIPYQIMSCPAIKAKEEDHSSSKEGELIMKAFVFWFLHSKKKQFFVLILQFKAFLLLLSLSHMDPIIVYKILDVQRLLLVHRNSLLLKSHTGSEPLQERLILS